jgi:hypothetical protein
MVKIRDGPRATSIRMIKGIRAEIGKLALRPHPWKTGALADCEHWK